jgi:hypothetical protein
MVDISAVKQQILKLSMDMQIDAMIKSGMSNDSSGSYFIEDISWTDFGSDKVKALNYLLHELLIRFPNLQFAQFESLKPSERGMLISWKPRWRPVAPVIQDEAIVLESVERKAIENG